MKKGDIILISAILVLAAAVLLLSGRSADGARLVVTVDGELFGSYSLGEDREIRIGSSNICVIRDGEVSMSEADCPDRVCVRSKPIRREGETIVCLPNRVILSITGEDGVDAPDAIAG